VPSEIPVVSLSWASVVPRSLRIARKSRAHGGQHAREVVGHLSIRHPGRRDLLTEQAHRADA
jgi:hypothetical protein